MKISIARRTQARLAVFEWLRGFNKYATNRLTMQFAGRHIYAVIHHQGRMSGKDYLTPVVAIPSGDGFIIPLPYGQHVDWCRNLLAAGECQMEWHGRVYTLRSPQLIEPEGALPSFPSWLHGLLRHTEVYLKAERASGPELPSGHKIRKILVYGAGVLGSVYAGKLHQAGYEVTLLARGKRWVELQEQGLVLVKDGATKLEQMPVRVIDQLAPDDAYDLVLVIVRKNQIASVLPTLAMNRCTPNVMFFVNNAEGPGALIEAIGRERVMLGFPGAGGQRVDGVIHYRLTPRIMQPTTIGELDGSKSERLAQIGQALSDAGVPVAISENMDAWLKTHIALVSPIANAIYLAGGSNYRLAHTRDGLVLMIRAVKEGLQVLHALHVPATPAKYAALAWLPEPLLVAILQKGMDTAQAELVLARHANAARDEMLTLAEEFRALARQSGIKTPAIDTLFCYLDPAYPLVPEGKLTIPLDWRSIILLAGGLLSAGMLTAWLFRKRVSGK